MIYLIATKPEAYLCKFALADILPNVTWEISFYGVQKDTCKDIQKWIDYHCLEVVDKHTWLIYIVDSLRNSPS